MRLDAGTAALLTLPPLAWAGNAVAARLLVGDVPPVALSLARWVIAFALLLPFAWRGVIRHRAAFARHWRILLLIGPLGVGAYNTLQYLALQTSTPMATSLIASSSPVFILALGAVVFSERARPAQWLGAALSVSAVASSTIRCRSSAEACSAASLCGGLRAVMSRTAVRSSRSRANAARFRCPR